MGKGLLFEHTPRPRAPQQSFQRGPSLEVLWADCDVRVGGVSVCMCTWVR